MGQDGPAAELTTGPRLVESGRRDLTRPARSSTRDPLNPIRLVRELSYDSE